MPVDDGCHVVCHLGLALPALFFLFEEAAAEHVQLLHPPTTLGGHPCFRRFFGCLQVRFVTIQQLLCPCDLFREQECLLLREALF
uniref:Putative secreted protein n=1 Tax=Ixodes ricinus TaxID=34613 RepID=A0A6B0U935_IXORI